MSAEKINVLLTEDDPNLGMLLREYLNAKGYETTLAVNGKKAMMSSRKAVLILPFWM